jgi:hypothetical protein
MTAIVTKLSNSNYANLRSYRILPQTTGDVVFLPYPAGGPVKEHIDRLAIHFVKGSLTNVVVELTIDDYKTVLEYYADNTKPAPVMFTIDTLTADTFKFYDAPLTGIRFTFNGVTTGSQMIVAVN